MTVTPTSLTRAAGISAAVAGLHLHRRPDQPPAHGHLLGHHDRVGRAPDSRRGSWPRLALAGITGMYLRQVRQTGVLGLVGYLVFAVGYLVMSATEIIAGGYVLPALAAHRARLRQRRRRRGHRRHGQG